METKGPVGDMFGHAWNSLMPLLFGLIGSEIDISVVLDNPEIILGTQANHPIFKSRKNCV